MSYRAWDREEKLGPPPWSHKDPKLIAWQNAHGHDVRLKCYPEYGCQYAMPEVTDEMVDRAAHVLAERDNYDMLGPAADQFRRDARRILEAAMT